MATEAQVEVPRIAIHSLMFVCHIRLVMLVAIDAREDSEVVGLDVARLALVIPLALVRSRENGEELGIVIEGSAFPIGCVVAIEAGDREALAAVFGIVILLVTGDAIFIILWGEDQPISRDGVARGTLCLLVRA